MPEKANSENQITQKEESIIRSIAFMFAKNYKNLNLDDLIQEGMEADVIARKTFDESLSIPFEVYLKSCVRNKLINYVNKKIKLLSMVKPIDDTINNIVYNIDEELEDMIFSKHVEEFIMTDDKLFTDEDKKIIRMKIYGFSYKEIAEKLNKSPKYIDNTLRKIRKIILDRFKI